MRGTLSFAKPLPKPLTGALIWGQAGPAPLPGKVMLWCPAAARTDRKTTWSRNTLKHIQEPTHRPIESASLEVGPGRCWGHCFSDTSLIILLYSQGWESLLYGFQKWRQEDVGTLVFTKRRDWIAAVKLRVIHCKLDEGICASAHCRLFRCYSYTSHCLKKPAVPLLS